MLNFQGNLIFYFIISNFIIVKIIIIPKITTNFLFFP